MSKELQVFSHVKGRPLGGDVYRGYDPEQDQEIFVKVGDASVLGQEADRLKKFKSFGFPVAEVVDYHRDSIGISVLTEGSLGRSFAEIISTEGKVSDETFNRLIDVIEVVINAQMNTAQGNCSIEEVLSGVHFDSVIAENPDLPTNLLNIALSKLTKRLEDIPRVDCHGDLGLVNVTPQGVIDLEYSFSGPAGYDVLTLPLIPKFIETDFPETRKQVFSPTQLERYGNFVSDIFSKRGFNNVQAYTDDFMLLKSIFFLSHLKEKPMTDRRCARWERRRAIFDALTYKYVNG